ncbi:DUF2949 domain-containing protein [Dactylococcopsis salina]|uniref:DUF2949 domain-containing protein n=1 Tax=Dactylococcopsis salina (strain PCC 8305) TaxID=13035 RepID=K9YVT0_DACS8|nr:DUF2949 domain-containing protein [Dactylococcopsis salina]AFZ51036.1 Protein of unknown function (DUF2949) [Dactylococcopsis salina PCC 8305]
MMPTTYAKFLRFLKEELAISNDSIAIAQRYSQRNTDPLPMLLWQYGLITLEQLERIYDWLETV